MYEHLEVFVGGRRSGKTTAAIKWVLEGEKREYWPYWSRVIVVPNQQFEEFMRAEYFHQVEDFSHRVFFKHEWDHRAPHVRRNKVEVLYEEASIYLPEDASAITLTAGMLTGLISGDIVAALHE